MRPKPRVEFCFEKRVRLALVQPTHAAQGVKRHDERRAEQSLEVRGDERRHEEVGVDDVVGLRIAEEVATRMAALADAGARVAVYEAALIVENGLQQDLDGLILVTAPPEAQIARMRLRDGASESEARARIASQLPEEEKARHATVVIDNSGSEADLSVRVERLIASL